jgi:hypothetical protein
VPNLEYAALSEADDLAKDALQKIEQVRHSRRSTDLARRLHRNWLMYYGMNDWKASLSDNLYADGPNGERVSLRVNHARNIIQHMHQMICAARPDFTARAGDMDVKSLKQTQIANAIIEHYLSFGKIWNISDMAAEYALTMHGGFIHGRWDPNKGEPWAAAPDDPMNPGLIAYQGDFVFKVHSLFDIYFDQTAHSWDTLVEKKVRDWENKYDVVARYPAHEVDIMRQRTKRDFEVYDQLPAIFFTSSESDEIEIYTYYHERTPSVPTGRQTTFLSDGTVLDDGPLMYDVIPVFRIVASEVMGTPHAWSPLTDIAPIQESINKGYSTAATNQFAFGVQNIWVPRGSRLDVTQFSGGLNFIEGSPVGPNGGKPEVLELLKTPPEVYQFIEMQIRDMETLTGVNQVVRGNPENNMTAGVALALVSTQSVQFLSPLQRSYAEATRDVLNFVVNTLKEKATTPRLVHMVGSSRKEALVYFSAADIDGINRVSYEIGNPMTRTPGGRMQLAQSVIEAGAMLNPNQILEIIDKGRLEPLTKGAIDQLDNIMLENEDLRNGMQVPVLAGDDDRLHLQEHVAELQNPDLRRNFGAQAALAAHITQHVNKYMMGDIIRGIVEGLIPPPYAMPQQPEGPGGEKPPGDGKQKKGQEGRKSPPEKKNGGGVPRLPEPQIPQQTPLPEM